MTLILAITAAICGLLEVCGVPTRVSWAGIGVVCLAVLHLL